LKKTVSAYFKVPISAVAWTDTAKNYVGGGRDKLTSNRLPVEIQKSMKETAVAPFKVLQVNCSMIVGNPADIRIGFYPIKNTSNYSYNKKPR